jgi:beta-exotoxin I transport system permease protein
MKRTNSSVAVFLWTFRRKWKGFVIFLVATALLVFLIVGIYPEFSDLQSQRMAEALGGDIEISLVQDKEIKGNYTLSWTKYGGVDGYVVVESDSDVLPALLYFKDRKGEDLQSGKILSQLIGGFSIQIFDSTTTKVNLTGVDQKYENENTPVHYGVLAFTGDTSKADIVGTSLTVNTRDMVAEGAYDKMLENPIMKAFVGEGIDIYSAKGFLYIELFGSFTMYIIIYFIIQYAGAFCSEMETKTIDILLSAPLRRRYLFISRYLSWVVLSLIFIVSWILCITLGVRAIGKGAEVPFGDIARTMFSFLPFILSVQSLCMLTSVLTNESRKAYGISLGIYFGMYFFEVINGISEKLNFLKYFTLLHYTDPGQVFIDGVIPWGSTLVLIAVAILLFAAGLFVFERKDLAT